jgi:hypothetical protein
MQDLRAGGSGSDAIINSDFVMEFGQLSGWGMEKRVTLLID